MVEETNSKYKNVMSGQVRRSKIVGQVLMLHSCSTCTLIIIKPIICIQVVVLGEGGGGGGEFQTSWLHNSAWFRTLGVGIIIIFNKLLCSN